MGKNQAHRTDSINIIDEDIISRLIVSPDGLFKAPQQGFSKYLLLNKAGSLKREKAARNIIDLVKKGRSDIQGFILADMFSLKIKKIKR